MLQRFKISRPADDPGPRALNVHAPGRVLRIERGADGVEVALDLEADAKLIADLRERYHVEELAGGDGDGDNPKAAFLKRRGRGATGSGDKKAEE